MNLTEINEKLYNINGLPIHETDYYNHGNATTKLNDYLMNYILNLIIIGILMDIKN